jgi:hypothetical protein
MLKQYVETNLNELIRIQLIKRIKTIKTNKSNQLNKDLMRQERIT